MARLVTEVSPVAVLVDRSPLYFCDLTVEVVIIDLLEPGPRPFELGKVLEQHSLGIEEAMPFTVDFDRGRHDRLRNAL